MLRNNGIVTFAELPDKHGYAGMYCGVSGDVLLCAGGANFPVEPLAMGGVKVWSDRIYLLKSPSAGWEEVGALPKACGYGVSATWRDAMVLAGGGDAASNSRDSYLVRWDGRAISLEDLPQLPIPMANGCGAIVGDTLYVAGGQDTPNSETALDRCYTLNLVKPTDGWVDIPWPLHASGRIQAVAGSQEGWFYLFSGIELVPNGDGTLERRYLTDAWRHNVESGWERLPDLPRAAAAAPTPVMLGAGAQLVITGGVWPEYLKDISLRDIHPGFSRAHLAYDIGRNAWSQFTECAITSHMPPARVTAATAVWRGVYVIPSGEVAPGLRTRSVMGYCTSS